VAEIEFIFLDAARTIDEKAIGAKAISLVRLKRIGLSVPAGFFITEAVFRQHLQQNNLTSRLKSAVNVLATAELSAKVSMLSDLRQAISDAPLAKAVCRKIEEHYRALGAGCVAVRSSATAEDLPGHSFAGQYDTYLSITNIEDCIDAVKKCWASLWTERAYNYRQKNGFDHLAVSMAVIVQQQVEPDAAGVAFSVDPVTGSPSRIVIESCFGLGDALVGGKVQPDHIVLRKKNLALVRWDIPGRQAERSTTENTGVCEKKTGSEDAPKPSLDLVSARKLARYVRKIESKFGCPQDIEWAIRDGRFYFLQARPVTTKPLAKTWEERQVWTNLNLGEVAPDVMTPFTYSAIEAMFKSLFGSIYRLFGADIDRSPVAALVAGRIYFNINTGLAIARPFISNMPNINIVAVGDFFGGEQKRMYELGLDIPDEDLPDVGFNWLKYILSWPRIICDLISHRPKKAENFLSRFRARADKLLGLDVESMSTDELARKVARFPQENWRDCDLLYFVTSAPSLLLFRKVCRDWLDDKDLTMANQLFSALGGMADVEASLQLWRLAELAHQDKKTETALLAGETWQQIRDRLNHTENGCQFLSAWDAFMSEHGHHCRGELEMSNPRWAELPDYILGLVRNYLRSIEQVNAVKKQQQLAERRQQLTEECRQRLKNPIKRMLFNWSLVRCQKLAVNRENWKNEAVRQVTAIRRMLLALGERLQQQGILKEQDDIFFLEIGEIESVAAGQADFNVKQRIETRRAEYEKNKALTPPPVVVGRFDPGKDAAAQIVTTASVLNGIGVSSGVVTGKARVILRTDEDQYVSPGEILVAPFTDPAWTPYFLPAAGVVMDLGGALSHGAIIAREYGIPAVVNVGCATKIIRTGQTIQVDGNRGIARIL
jgi:pyruvate,water dikinase